MDRSEIIDKIFKEAVGGINANTLSDADFWYSYVINLPDDQKTVYTIAVLNQQVFNGGFHQYFFNGYGQFAAITIGFLKDINALIGSQLLQEALELVNYQADELDNFRRKVFNREIDKLVGFDDDLMGKLEALDNKFNCSTEDLEVLLGNYLRLL